ncbi:hormogonium polysaccharide biosynthesis glycosyltransferase HpsE [Leptothoe spongobia]|uniref:Glycosyltransferase family 2 protein n=1 Tax=Leptothoe spongobia TAU-MAC 1115 TaxID=1967444 RepID=A0A947DCN4_9CYAN|nr:hormogonium polysaccharide biosynthesis glycosyltransferase HpsE [Leptothoe spongobia]MBT9313964.1 glycosyltransferase family 2 protein [Leptothoe spongobia TAU-MAC 1115]
MIDFTVAIPTYNGSKRLPQLLEKLRSQTGTEHFSWAILVVDNNSTDNTKDVIRLAQAHWPKDSPALDYVFESKQGAAFARITAMERAESEWVSFLDDDVLPAADWLAQAYAFAQEHPDAGAYGGQIHANFEVEPPPNFSRIQSFLAIRERGPTPHRYDPNNLVLPPSAAWVISKRAWQDNVPLHPKLGGRTQDSMVQGDDYAPLLYMHRTNWEIWYNPDMHVFHQIPKSRLDRTYLTTLSRGCGLCICQLRMINAQIWQKPFLFTKLLLSNLRRVILHWIKYRHLIQTDLVAACEMEFFVGSFVSPFYYLKTSLLFRK